MIIMVLGNKSDKKHERLVNIKEVRECTSHFQRWGMQNRPFLDSYI